MQPKREASAALPPAGWFDSNRHARISFSRLAVFHRCPAWYRHQYLEWHRAWSPAVTRAGHAVQSAFEELVHLEPPAGPAPKDLLAWARAEARRLLAPHMQRAESEHEKDPNGWGPWDLDFERYAGYVERAAALHVEEVLARAAGRHPRTGEALDLEPLEDLACAWAAVVPWHVPSPEPLAGMEHVPGGFFQGQYDLVYGWTGGRRIVDLKASSGASPFSTEIATQLTAYAYLERALGRGRPEGVEAWFLGREQPWVMDVPAADALDAFEQEVVALFQRSAYTQGFGAFPAHEFPVTPAQAEGHEPAEGAASAWCAFCPASFSCEKSGKQLPDAAPGASFDDLQAAARSGNIAIQGIVTGVGEVQNKRGKDTRRFSLSNRSGTRSFTWDDRPHVQRLVQQGLRAGRTISLEGLRPWRHPKSGDILLYPTPGMTLRVLDDVAP